MTAPETAHNTRLSTDCTCFSIYSYKICILGGREYKMAMPCENCVDTFNSSKRNRRVFHAVFCICATNS